jgi:hypothetical protein
MTAGMTDQRLAEAALAEIVELHRFFVDWFTGHCPKNRAGFARVADALAPGFVQVDPAGRERRRGPLLTALRAAHGSRAGEPFAIRIVRPKIQLVRRGLALAIYEERQRSGGAITRRRSSALFQPAATAPGGVAWLHLQETWIAP